MLLTPQLHANTKSCSIFIEIYCDMCQSEMRLGTNFLIQIQSVTQETFHSLFNLFHKILRRKTNIRTTHKFHDKIHKTVLKKGYCGL